MEYKGQWVIVTLSQNSDFFLAVVNLQYLTILIKSKLQDVNSQFQYRSLNCEIKRSQLLFLLFYSVTETSLHTYIYYSNQRPCMLEFLLITGISYHGAPSTPNTHPLERLFGQGSNSISA